MWDRKLIGICSYGESAKAIKKYMDDNKIEYTLLMDDKWKAANMFGAKVVTTSAVVSPDGKVVYLGGWKSRSKWPVKSALNETLQGKSVSVSTSKARG